MSARKFLRMVAVALVLVVATTTAAQARTLDGAISGTVLDSNGKPAAGVKVQAWAGQWTGLYSKDWVPFRSPVTTGRNGSYKITVPPGTYRVWFVPSDRETYCMEAFPDAAQPYWGDDVVVKTGRTTTRVSVKLDRSPGALEGTVYDASTGLPLEGVKLRLGFQAYAIINTEFGDTWSDASGHYRFSGLKSWDWGAWATDERGTTPHYLELLLFNGEWTPQPGTKTLDFDMEPEGFVSVRGRITDSVSGNGIPGANVGAYIWEDEGYYDYTYTDADSEGYFEFVNLPAGQWEFYGTAPGYEDRFYGGEQDYGEEIYVQRGQPITLGEWTLQLSNP